MKSEKCFYGFIYDSNQKGFALLSVVFAMLAFSVVGLSVGSMVSVQANRTLADYQGQQAFYVADGGLQYILKNEFENDADSDFSNNTSPTASPYGSPSISLGDGEFWAQYSSVTQTSADVTVTAKVGNAIRAIRQTVTATPGTGLGYADASYSHGNFNVGGGNGVVNGSVRAAGNINIGSGWTVSGTTTPNSYMSFTLFNLSTYTALTDSTISGNYTLPVNYTGNIYVTGNLTIADNSNISGIIVSAGNITINSNVSVTGTIAAAGNFNGSNESNIVLQWAAGPSGEILPALTAGGNINLGVAKNGSVSVNGYMLCNGNLNFTTQKNATLTINGFTLAAGNSNFSNQGIVTVNYDSALGGSGGTGTIDFSDWREL